jgi:hypothetical protein
MEQDQQQALPSVGEVVQLQIREQGKKVEVRTGEIPTNIFHHKIEGLRGRVASSVNPAYYGNFNIQPVDVTKREMPPALPKGQEVQCIEWLTKNQIVIDRSFGVATGRGDSSGPFTSSSTISQVEGDFYKQTTETYEGGIPIQKVPVLLTVIERLLSCNRNTWNPSKLPTLPKT